MYTKDYNSINYNKGSDDSKSNDILLEISKDLKREKIVSEMKYIAALEYLKITFSKYYDNREVHLHVDIKNWYVWAGNLKAMIRRRVESLDDYDYLLIEKTILNNLNLIHEANEKNSQRILKNKQREEEERGKTSHLKKYVFEGVLYESTTIQDKNPKFIVISPSSSSPQSSPSADSSSNEDDENLSDERKISVDNVKIELINKIDVPNDDLFTQHPIPYSSVDSQEELKNNIEVAKKIKIGEESPQVTLGGTES